MDRPTLTNVCEATSQSHELDNYRPIHRKGKKLLAEKKRRARINNCLLQIRDLVCEGEEDKDSDIDKMEKAEILEKTLEVLTRLRRQSRPVRTSPLHYASGFSSCAEESIRYIQSSRLVPAQVKAQLQQHLRSIARRVQSNLTETVSSYLPQHYAAQHTAFSGGPGSVVSPTSSSSSSVIPTEAADPMRGYRIPSPILTSTPVTAYPSQQLEEENSSLQKPSTFSAKHVSSSSQLGSRKYECITPDITDPAQERCSSFHHQHRQQLDEENLNKKVQSRSVDGHIQTSYLQRQALHEPATSSQPAQPYCISPTCLEMKSALSDSHTPTSPKLSSYNLHHPHSPMVLHPSQKPDISSSQFHTLYSYLGYEPYPTAITTNSPPSIGLSSSLSSAARSASSYHVTPVRPTPVFKSQVGAPGLDLCVNKKLVNTQISPESMWRPW